MINRYRLFCLVFVLIICLPLCHAQEYRNATGSEKDLDILGPDGTKINKAKFELGPGMEIIKVGEINIVAPKGTRVHKVGSHVIFEDIGEYLGRKFDELDKRLEKIELQQGQLKDELGQLKKELEGMKSSLLQDTNVKR